MGPLRFRSCRTEKILVAEPLVRNVAHQQPAVKIYGALRELRFVCKVTRLDMFDLQRFYLPVITVQLQAIVSARRAGFRIAQGPTLEKIRGLRQRAEYGCIRQSVAHRTGNCNMDRTIVALQFHRIIVAGFLDRELCVMMDPGKDRATRQRIES